MKKLIATLAALLATSITHAGNYGTCLNLIGFSNSGVIDSSGLRQCEPVRYTQEMLETALASEYYKVAEQQHTTILRSNGAWLILTKSRDGSFVSEVTMFFDRSI